VRQSRLLISAEINSPVYRLINPARLTPGGDVGGVKPLHQRGFGARDRLPPNSLLDTGQLSGTRLYLRVNGGRGTLSRRIRLT